MKSVKAASLPVIAMLTLVMVGCGGGGGGKSSSRDSQPEPQTKTLFSEWVGDMMEVDQDELMVDVNTADVDENDSNEEGAFDGFF